MATTYQFAADFAPIAVQRRRSNTTGQTIYHAYYKGQHMGSVTRWEDDPKVWIFRNRHGNELTGMTSIYYGDSLKNAIDALFNYWWCELGGDRFGK